MQWLLLGVAVLAGCPAPGIYSVHSSGVTCERAMRVAYRTMIQLRYQVVEVEDASPTKAGRIVGTKTGPGGDVVRSSVRIRCDDDGVRLQPVEGALVPANYEFSRTFGYSFTTLVERPDVETPSAERGLQVLLERIDDGRAQVELGGVVLADEAVLVRLTVRNHTDFAVEVDATQVRLIAINGDPVRPLSGESVRAVLGTSSAAAKVRADLLRRARVPADETLVRYLVFPLWDYGGDAQIAIEDVVTGESDGFLISLQ